MAGIQISGAVSKMDTASIVDGLVSLQANQQTLLKSKQSAAQKTSDAYTSLVSTLGTLATAAKKVADTNAWSGLSATSSSTAVTATATGTTASSLTFDVTALAKRHALVSANSVGSMAAVVASGPLTLTGSDGTVSTIDVGGGTLDEVVTAINAAKAGVTASAVQTAPGQFRLQVQATTTGSASEFTLDGLDGFSAVDVLAQGSDAVIHVGDALTGFDVTSASNTFKDVVPGLSFTVSKIEADVTVSSSVDGSSVATDVQALVDAANTVLSEIASKSTWNATTRTGGPLTGQAAVRSLTQSVLATVAAAGAPGVELTRDGKLSFDKTKFLDAFAADPAGVAAAFGPAVRFEATAGVTGSVSLVAATDAVTPASYAVTATSAPAREQWQVPTTGTVEGLALVLERGTDVFSYTAPPGQALADSVLAVNARLAAAGFGVGVTLSGSDLVLTASAPGTGSAFTASLDSVAGTQLVAGADVAGTIDGEPATGAGDVLSLTTGGSGAAGMSLRVVVSDADITASGGDIGTVTYGQGLAKQLSALVAEVTSTDGVLKTAKAGNDSTVKDLQSQIDGWDRRLESYRQMLTRQFTAMETAIASLQSQTSWLASFSTSSSSNQS